MRVLEVSSITSGACTPTPLGRFRSPGRDEVERSVFMTAQGETEPC